MSGSWDVSKDGQDFKLVYDVGVAKQTLKLEATTGDVHLGNSTLGHGLVTLYDDQTPRKFVALQAPASITADQVYVLPPADGDDGDVLSTNGSGTLSWTTPGGGGGGSSRGFIYAGLKTTTTGTAELKMLNGSDNTYGQLFPMAVTLVKMSLQCVISSHSSNGVVTAEIYKNGSATGQSLSSATITGNGDVGATGTVSVSIAAGDAATVYWTDPAGFDSEAIAVLVEYTT